MPKKYLSGAYTVKSAEQTKQLYKEWADTYDDELESQGYASPARTAMALAACADDLFEPVLDIGCGSGVSGECLLDAGFTELHGSDFSAEMLVQADQKQVYKALHLADFDSPFDFIQSPFKLMTAVGVFTSGHAEPDVLKRIIELMPIDGLFGFSLNQHSLKEQAYTQLIHSLVMERKLRIRWQDYGDHIPGINLSSMVLVIEKIAT